MPSGPAPGAKAAPGASKEQRIGVMDACRDINPLVTRVVDEEAAATDRGRVDGARARVRALPAAAARRAGGPSARARAGDDAGRPCAARSARQVRRGARRTAPQPVRRALPLLSRARWPIALAATLVLAMAGSAFYGLVVNPSKAVAAQLALDHLKCFTLFEEPAGLCPAEVQAELKARYGIDIVLPSGRRGRRPGARRRAPLPVSGWLGRASAVQEGRGPGLGVCASQRSQAESD